MIHSFIRLINRGESSLSYRFYKWYNPHKFRGYGISVGTRPRLLGSIYLKVDNTATVTIGDNVEISSGNAINPLTRNIRACICAERDAIVRIGNNVGISSVCLWIHSQLQILNNVKIGGGTVVLDSNSHSLDYLKRRDNQQDSADRIDAPIVIEEDVLIGAYCIILKGVTIGARSIIGAYSVVTHDIPSDCIAAGNPCRVIKQNK